MKTKFLAAIVAFLFVSCGGGSSDPYYSSSGSSSSTGGSNVSFKGKYTKTSKKVNLYNYNGNWYIAVDNVDVYTDGYNYYIRDYKGDYSEISSIDAFHFGYESGFRYCVFWGANTYYLNL